MLAKKDWSFQITSDMLTFDFIFEFLGGNNE